jgi:hypothetical protein
LDLCSGDLIEESGSGDLNPHEPFRGVVRMPPGDDQFIRAKTPRINEPVFPKMFLHHPREISQIFLHEDRERFMV